MYRFTGFTQKANEALNNAITAAEDLGHTYVGSEHLLLGLLSENGGMAYTALSARKVTYAEVESIIKSSVGIGSPTVLSPNDFTPRAKNIMTRRYCRAEEWVTPISARSIYSWA